MNPYDQAEKEVEACCNSGECIHCLRARLAECEAVMEQAIYAIRSGGERHLFADESEAIELYETYKSSHEVKK